MKRVILVVLDSVGIGAARDAARFGDEKAHTLRHIGEWCEKNLPSYKLPNLARWGLGRLVQSYGIPADPSPKAAFGRMRELSPGKDTTTGHWEMAGTVLEEEFPVYENGFDEKLLDAWTAENGLPGWLCNKPASGTTVIDQFGEEHLRTGKPIVYTSGDSVLQIAWSEEKFGIEKLYAISKSARRYVDPLGVGRVIARPFTGSRPGEFKRTENRRDYSVPPPHPNMLDVLREKNGFVAGVGKIEDIFAHRSVNIVEHTGRNETSLEATVEVMERTKGQTGLVFTNLIDFDQLHGHRRNPKTYAEALMNFDAFLPRLEAACGPEDVLVLTADHGNDPTHPGTDHTREDVPLLVWSPNPRFKASALGELEGFATVARLALETLGLGDETKRLKGADRAPSIAPSMGLG
jgi:phosphopentomutase